MVNGNLTNNMVRVSRLGQMAAFTKVNTSKVKNMDMETSPGLTAQTSQEILLITTFRDMASTTGAMEELTQEIGSQIKCKAKEFLPGLTDANMKAPTLMIKRKDRASSIGRTVESTMVAGSTANNMERHNYLSVEKSNQVNGFKVKELDGWSQKTDQDK